MNTSIVQDDVNGTVRISIQQVTQKGDKLTAAGFVKYGVMPLASADIQRAEDAETLVPSAGNHNPQLLTHFHPHGANHRKKAKCAFVFTKEDCVLRCICYGLYDIAYLDPSFWVIGIGGNTWAIKGITKCMKRAVAVK